jgi:hypothetical protein
MFSPENRQLSPVLSNTWWQAGSTYSESHGVSQAFYAVNQELLKRRPDF